MENIVENYSLLFQALFIVNANENFDIASKRKPIKVTEKKMKNDLIEIFFCQFYALQFGFCMRYDMFSDVL